MIRTRAYLFPKQVSVVRSQTSVFQTARHNPLVGHKISSVGSQTALKKKINIRVHHT